MLMDPDEQLAPKKAPKHPSERFADDTVDPSTVCLRPIDPDPPKMKGIRLQTEKVERVNRRLQSVETTEMEVQTITAAELEGVHPEYDEVSLMQFLHNVVPIMEEELDLASHPTPAFDNYEPVWDDMVETCELTQQVYKEGLVDLQISAVAWNCTGAMLACSYGKLDTLGWCEVTAPVCIWNLFRPQLAAGEPDVLIQTLGFVMCLAWHPTQPATLAGGTYNGELLIWNTAGNDLDPLVASSSIDDYFHREAIQSVEWIPADLSGGLDAYMVATISGDGKVLIWDARKNDLSYPSSGFMLFGGGQAKKRILGGSSLSFSPVDPWLFVVGCETGVVMRAFRPPPGASFGRPTGQYSWKNSAVAILDQLAANARLQLQNHVEQFCRTQGINEVSAEVVFQSKPDHSVIFPSPKTTNLEGHAGSVTVSSFSPFYRKLLLTGSVDGSVKLYDVLQQRPLQTFFPPTRHISACAVSAASWSSARPCVFAVAMEMGGVYIYDLMQSRQEPVLTLPLAASGSQRVTSLSFNPKQRGLLVVGDANGRVRVFRLPFKLSMQQKEEVMFINRLMKNSGDTISK